MGLARRLSAASRRLSVLALDLTGHGASPPLPAEATLETLARDALRTAEALGLAKPLRIIGHSLGGRVALRACLADAAAVGDVTLLDITPSPTATRDPDMEHLLATLGRAPSSGPSREAFRDHFRRGGLPDAIVEWLLLNLTEAEGVHRWRIDRAALAALHGRSTAEDLWPAVEEPRGYPVRCIRGSLSRFVTSADARRLEAAGCPVETIPGAGHFLHVDRPAELAALLLRDLAGRTRGKRA